jgi:hypothetical protein
MSQCNAVTVVGLATAQILLAVHAKTDEARFFSARVVG